MSFHFRSSAFVVLLLICQAARGQEASDGEGLPTIPPEKTVATVDGEMVSMADVQAVLAAAAKNQSAVRVGAAQLAQALESEIDQRLVRRYVITATTGATKEQLDEAFARVRANIQRQGLTLEQVLTERKTTEAELRDQLNWQISWAKYQEQSLTDAALEQCFDRHRRDLDGTQLRVSHILLRVDQPRNAEVLAGAKAEAAHIRQEIADGKLTFADAARKYSVGPSRRNGGDLGLVGRDGPMAPAFNDAAFALQKGELSGPVVTAFGVHLITVTDEKPGAKRWTDMPEKLKQIVASEMVDQIAKQQREHAKIEYVDDFPHFQPGTKDLAPLTGSESAKVE